MLEEEKRPKMVTKNAIYWVTTTLLLPSCFIDVHSRIIPLLAFLFLQPEKNDLKCEERNHNRILWKREGCKWPAMNTLFSAGTFSSQGIFTTFIWGYFLLVDCGFFAYHFVVSKVRGSPSSVDSKRLFPVLMRFQNEPKSPNSLI